MACKELAIVLYLRTKKLRPTLTLTWSKICPMSGLGQSSTQSDNTDRRKQIDEPGRIGLSNQDL